MTFAPVALENDAFLEHVSHEIVGNASVPDDFEPTLWYVLYQLPERNREVFLKIERDHIPVRAIGLEYGVTGQRIFDLNKSTIENMLNNWGDLLRFGILQFMQNMSDVSKRLGRENAKEHYYKIGYTDGYEDGYKHKKSQHFSTEEFSEINLTDLNLSPRTYHYLFDAGLLTISQIIEKGDDLMKLANIGKVSLTELIERLDEFGVNVHAYFPRIIRKYKIVLEGEND